MVSRSETARPLLTPGEIMQLPPDDEIVMVAGIPPIRTKKARYFDDARFRERLLPAPANLNAGFSPKPDDWSALKPIPAPSAGRNGGTAKGKPAKEEEADKQDGDSANAGLRREPGLEQHKDIAPEPERKTVNEFDPDMDEPERDAVTNRTLARNMRLVARQISMDPGDGMEL
ncbi:hypothetical protein Q644_00520 [Brucella intermedia 229E]|uniref:Conjugal transfer protein TraG n=2 Tax=Brucella intermedia TaxID=94625 RepID=U4VH79_9HYPH|nr:hypothetical protein Q644_00520 [Brucella intermedia 229E]